MLAKLCGAFCPAFKAPHGVLLIGLALLLALYVVYMYTELRRLDARLQVVANQLASAQRATQQQLETLQQRLLGSAVAEGSAVSMAVPGGLQALLPMIFSSSSKVPSATVEEEGEEDDDDAGGEMEDERLRLVLVGADGDGDGDEDEDEDEDEDDGNAGDDGFVRIEEIFDDVVVASTPLADVTQDAPPAVPDAPPAVPDAHPAVPDAPAAAADAPAAAADAPAAAADAASVDPSTLKVEDLRQLLKSKGLDSRGTKGAMLERLAALSA